jgi:predicted amidohydrolase
MNISRKIAVLQMTSGIDPAANQATIVDAAAAAAAGGAMMLFTPEVSGLVDRDRERAAPNLFSEADDPVLAAMRAAAAHHGIWVHIGSLLIRRDDGKLANRGFVIDGAGEIRARYDKLHMFDVDLPNGESARESATYEPGDRAVVAEAGGTRLGLTICYDVRFPALYRALALGGAEVLTVPAAFTRPTGKAHWEVLLRARAIETGSFVLAPAQGGFHEDGRGTWGHSLAVSPWGEVIGHLDHDEPGVLFAALDLAAVQKARQAIPALVNARQFQGP